MDLPFYRAEIRPVLPPTVLDFHAHVWSSRHWRKIPDGGSSDGRYMVVETEYPVESLAASAAEIVAETLTVTISERGATRLDDRSSESAMERRKKEGYF